MVDPHQELRTTKENLVSTSLDINSILKLYP